jgi:hypothetical protein
MSNEIQMENYKITSKEKVSMFKEELDFIQDEDIKKFATKAVSLLPNYFFFVPASSTGKFHPEYTKGVHGLVYHVKAAVHFLNYIFQLKHMKEKYSQREMSCGYTAMLLHDGRKHGEEGKSEFTVFLHPLLISQWLKENEELQGLINNEDLLLICSLCETHMGEWTTQKNQKNVLEEPKTDLQKLIHMCDYLSSRHDIEFHFEKTEEVQINPLTYKLTFGKHLGQTLEEIANEHRDYLEWLVENVHREPVNSIVKQFLAMK